MNHYRFDGYLHLLERIERSIYIDAYLVISVGGINTPLFDPFWLYSPLGF